MATETTTATTATTATAQENVITAQGTVAVLPPCLLWLASVTASDDCSKKVLTSIEVRRTDKGMIRITSTDGHRCTKVEFPQSENFFISQDQQSPFRLKAKAFNKLPSRKRALCSIQSDGLAKISDPTGKLIEAFEWGEEETVAQLSFPNVDQVWPEDSKFTCKPGKFIAFDARYLVDCCSAAARLSFSNNVVQIFTTDHNLAPVVLRWKLDLAWLLCRNTSNSRSYVSYAEDDVVIETLIMPIRIRD